MVSDVKRQMPSPIKCRYFLQAVALFSRLEFPGADVVYFHRLLMPSMMIDESMQKSSISSGGITGAVRPLSHVADDPGYRVDHDGSRKDAFG